MILKMGKHELEMGSKYLTNLRDSNDILDQTDKLRKRMEEEGYLLFRGFHDREKVLAARRNILEKLQLEGKLADGEPIDEGIIGPQNKGGFYGGGGLDFALEFPDLLELVNSPKVMSFFNDFLEGTATTYNYKWPRAVGREGFTGAHYDIVYMGRGTRNLYTMWTPLGDTPLEQGPLAICLGSQNFEKIKETYGKMDVDRDRVSNGWLSTNPIEIVDKYGGQWATTPFSAGDVIIFGMFTLHASINNTTNRYRISVDTRYQLNTEPMDERWVGTEPLGHTKQDPKEQVTMEESRIKWGI
ncbi:phytanoyl-CoA dioxygenase family protein [Lederbergia panacisoli]|uniref:phytanoyl-CoA dioxygenase family protein n=1 Tax=Lederbergia panacisoli TaxID=1255251 RepID=UPI00214B4CC3|nr:phytanoyl-CoA dioxygenase family protein [Lederbergia panacisoli]MCR2823059.1 phytanoyl-CoA dioxygenase family protein [Lederbergia panacisoli]